MRNDLINRSELLNSLIHCQELGRKSFEAVINVVNNQPIISEQEIRDNAIEEFCKRLVEQSERFSTIPFMWVSTKNIQKIAEQMKEVGE